MEGALRDFCLTYSVASSRHTTCQPYGLHRAREQGQHLPLPAALERNFPFVNHLVNCQG